MVYAGYAYLAINFFNSWSTPDADPSNWATLTIVGPQGPAGNDGANGSNGQDGQVQEAPYDGNYYARQNNSWVSFSPGGGGGGGGGIGDAPYDGVPYVRYNGNWNPLSWYDQTGGSNPPYYHSVWAYGSWQSANLTSIYDPYSNNYYNVLTI